MGVRWDEVVEDRNFIGLAVVKLSDGLGLRMSFVGDRERALPGLNLDPNDTVTSGVFGVSEIDRAVDMAIGAGLPEDMVLSAFIELARKIKESDNA